MGWFTLIKRKDGTKSVIRSNSRWHLKHERSKVCRDNLGKFEYVSPMIEDNKAFNLPMMPRTEPSRKYGDLDNIVDPRKYVRKEPLRKYIKEDVR